MSQAVARTRHRLIGALTVVASLGLAAGSALAGNPHEPTADIFGNISEKVVHRSGQHAQATRSLAPTAGATTANASPITYHNGPVMTSISKIVVIWYGNWAQSNGTDNAAGQQIILDALYGLSATPTTGMTNYTGITTGASSNLGLYTQTGGQSVTQISSPTVVQYTQPVSATYGSYTLTDAKVQALVANYAATAPDPNAIYLVLSSSDVGESSGFLTKYCGWHTYSTVAGTSIKYGFIGNPNKTLSACNANTAGVSPNGNPAVDAMISVIAHELEETATDPLISAWYNRSQAENGDMCAWTFGSSQTKLANGSYYNVTLPTASGGTRNYLLQRALASSNSKCYVNATGAVQ